jgi:tetratricopeptide (TPR) repeat protein
MRFLKGVILTEQNRQADAIAVFSKLTEDYPDLPEPYNNLAVLYAGSGQYDKARAALENAIRTNPSYATAYENLGDIHARLASQAYDKALQLDSANNGAKSKLTLLRSLAVTGSKPAASSIPAAGTKLPSAPPVVVAQAPRTVAAAPAPAPAIPAVPAVSASKQAAAPAPAPAASTKAEPAKPAPSTPARSDTARSMPPSPEARASKAARATDEGENERSEVINTVHGWARAWSARDVKGYLNYYASDFQTPNGESRKAWASERESRIAGKGSISVRIESPVVSIDGNTATVKFRQNYVSDRLTASSRKTLTLVKHGGKWHIKQERTGN